MVNSKGSFSDTISYPLMHNQQITPSFPWQNYSDFFIKVVTGNCRRLGLDIDELLYCVKKATNLLKNSIFYTAIIVCMCPYTYLNEVNWYTAPVNCLMFTQ